MRDLIIFGRDGKREFTEIKNKLMALSEQVKELSDVVARVATDIETLLNQSGANNPELQASIDKLKNVAAEVEAVEAPTQPSAEPQPAATDSAPTSNPVDAADNHAAVNDGTDGTEPSNSVL